MAGVSLALRRMLRSPFYGAQALGYVYAGIAMAGPWLLTSFFMVAVTWMDWGGRGEVERSVFQAIVLYGYGGSMILTGLFQLVVARHVSDELYLGRTGSVVSCAAGAGAVSLVLHLAAAAAFAALTRPPLLLAAAEVAFFGSVGQVWNAMIFLGTIRDYGTIVAAFAGGVGAGLGAAWGLAAPLGVPGLLFAFAIGHAVTAALLGARLRAEFPSEGGPRFAFARTFVRYPALMLIGVAYAGGVWVDKLILWAGPTAVRLPLGLTAFPLYDNAVFLAYLTIVPALALVFVRIEVSFHAAYRKFFGAIRHGADLEAIQGAHARLRGSLERSVRQVALLQGVLTGLVILLAPRLLEALRLDRVQYYVFRAACLGAYLQALVLALLLAGLHLAVYRPALGMTLAYFLACALGTAATALLGLPYYGYGTVAAGLTALAVGYPWILRRVRDLDYRTFMLQPV